ncbi:hypothetical protein GCM10023185_00230 [Hymenobacter saemangeumensis]|uniref:TolC family protein n=1 Tax=Hymenobacter saemangeumensis TaxID=1084522 RepID=A0ABP8HWC8_9BACT
MCSKTLLIGLLLALHVTRAAGQAAGDAWQSVFFDSPTRALPLLTAAALKHSGELQALEINKALSEEDIKLAKRSLLNNVAVGAGYNYGNQLSFGIRDPGDPNQFTSFSMGRYSVGATLSLPVGQVVNRSTLIHKEELNYQRSEALRREQENRLRQQIIPMYQNVLLARKVMQLQQEAYVNAQTANQLAEKQFKQGQLTLQEFSNAGSQLTAAAIAQELARSQYDTAFLLLEEVVGAKISTLMTPSP